MATLNFKKKSVTLEKPVEVSWNTFKGGLNLLLQDIELKDTEYKRGDNLILKGSGILTQRPGTAEYFSAGSGKVRRLKRYVSKTGVHEILALTDGGYLTKKNGDSYSIIPGASFASGSRITMAQINDNIFITSKSDKFIKYNGATLVPYLGLSKPTNLRATKSSGTTGAFSWAWRVSAESGVGETLACEEILLSNLPEFLDTDYFVSLSWNTVASAEGYVIYGRESGGQTFLTRVPATATSWIDNGNSVPSLYSFPPEDDFTTGPKGKYVITSGDKLIVANIENNPSRLVFSGGGPNIDKFHWSKGGGYVDVAKDDGEEITGLKDFESNVLVFKTNSVYNVSFTYNDTFGIVQPVVKKITDSVGCLSHDTVLQVVNDVFYVGRRSGGGISINSLGYEANFTNVLRSGEISEKIRSELESINQNRLEDMWAIYWNNKYWFFYPIGTESYKCIGYDRERSAFIGPFNFPNNPSCGEIYYDSTGLEHFIYGDGDDGAVTEIAFSYNNDKGSNFTWTLETKREEYKNPMRLKNLLSFFIQLRNVSGNVNVEVIIETKTGDSTVTKAVQIEQVSSLAGFGSFSFGSTAFGSTGQASSGVVSLRDIIKYITLNKTSIRSYTIRVSGTGARAEIVSMKSILTLQSMGSVPALWRA